MMHLSVFPRLIAVISFMSAGAAAGVAQENHGIIPAPAQVKTGKGHFAFNPATRILYDPDLKGGRDLADLCRAELSRSTGFPLATGTISASDDENVLMFLAAAATDELGSEGYTLTVTPRNIKITAAAAAGCFYGYQTLRQLLPVQVYSTSAAPGVAWQAPAVTIKDRPRFAWRGFMLDVARHYFDKDTVKKLIDALALHKFNILHLHLTDTNAWRLMIDHYPGLTGPEVTRASYYKGPYKTFFTKEDIRDIVEYARVRQISVIPEIDMPGHSRAAVTAYPEFGHAGALNPGKAETYVFLKNILSEVMDLFPASYIHMGGDEARLSESLLSLPEVKTLMEQQGLQTLQDLEGYFDKQITDFIVEKGKTPCGWEEASRFDLDPAFIAFWWMGRHVNHALDKGYRVVACPYKYCYLHQGQELGEAGHPGYPLPIVNDRLIYGWEPTADFPESQASQILGVQACFWTSIVHCWEYMNLPRLAALAEVAWSPKGTRNDYAEYARRVDRQIERYQQMGLYFREPVANIKIGEWSPGAGKTELDPLALDITHHLHEAQTIGLVFYLPEDSTPVDKIQTVELLENDQVIASARRLYFWSYKSEMFKTHVYTFDVDAYRPGATYRVRATARPGRRFKAVVYLRPFVQPETYSTSGAPWHYWPARLASIFNTRTDRPLPAGENMLRNSSFEEDESAPYIDYWFMWYPDNAVLDDTVAKHGLRSVRLKPLRYDRDITYKYVTNLEKGKTYTLSVWARADKPDSLLLAYIGPESSYPRGLCKRFRVGADWQRLRWSFAVSADMDAKKDQFQLGLMNPEFYYPEWDTGTLDKGQRSTRRKEGSDQIVVTPKNGVIWLDAVQLELGETSTPYKPDPYDSENE